MNIPDFLKLGWRKYKIELGEHRSGKELMSSLYGEIAYEDNKIYIYQQLDHDNQCVTLLHEIIHWIFYNSGQPQFRNNEELVTMLSENLYQVIKENPILFYQTIKED
jgi:Zn-dependent peptidase ImmA (M78 family)